MTGAAQQPLLSLFPGADLLGRAFEEAGHPVARGPDPIVGGDIRTFSPPAGYFVGVFGGPPCQDFSSLRRTAPTGYGLKMLEQFRRVVECVQPEWWLMENVARVPDVMIPGYTWQRIDVDQAWWTDVSRLRHIQFGSRRGVTIEVARNPDRRKGRAIEGAALASDSRSFRDVCRLQGLPDDFDLPGWTVEAKVRAVGNGVPLVMGRALVRAIHEAYARSSVTVQRTFVGVLDPVATCAGSCGRRVKDGRKYCSPRCRKAAQRRRDRAVGKERVHP